MHLDSTFDALSNGTNYKFQFQDKSIYEISSHMSNDDKEKSENEILAKGNNSCKSRSNAPKSNLTCIVSRQIHIWNFNSLCQKMTKKSPENEF